MTFTPHDFRAGFFLPGGSMRSIIILFLAFLALPAWSQALPASTPPLADIWEAANDFSYGRTGTDPDAAVGRDKMYRGVTPANDASFTRRGRSSVPAAQAGLAVARFAKKFGPISTVLALTDLAADLNGIWRQSQAGDWELEVLVDGSTYKGLNPRTGEYDFIGQLPEVCAGIKGAYEAYGDGPYTVSPSDGACNLKRGTQNIGTSVIKVASGTISTTLTEGQLAGEITVYPALPQTVGQVDQSPEYGALPSTDPAKIPWSPEVVILPEPIVLAPRTETLPDGSTKVIQTTLTPTSSATGPIFWSPVTTETTTAPDGSVKTGTSEGAPGASSEPTPFEMPCGVAGKPPCHVKVDETGVPTSGSLDANKGKDAEQPLDDFLRNPTSIIPAFPTINWAFALPTSCGVIPTPAFEPAFTSLDVCQFQPMFHEIMNVVWMLGGLFGAISLFMKSALAD